MRFRPVLFLLLFANPLACGLAGASDEAHTEVRFSPAHFDAQREAIMKGIRGTTYRELSDDSREAVLQALSRMERLLDGVQDVARMDKRDQTAVFNDQELINNLLTEAAADSRLICKREKMVGSHRTTNICLTVAERRRLLEAAQDQIRRLQRSGELPQGG